MSGEIKFKKTEMSALDESSGETLEECEKYKKCILYKINDLVRAFEQDTATKDDGLIEKIQEFYSTIEKTNPELITKESHLAQIVGSLVGKGSFVFRREKLRKRLSEAKTEEDAEQIEKDIKVCEGPIAEIKQSLYRYITMCVADGAFRGRELASRLGFWGETAIPIDVVDSKVIAEGIAEKQAQYFINHSWEHYENGKVSGEIKLAA